MSNTVTLQDFMVRLGFKIDDSTQRRFVDAVKQAEMQVLALSATVAAMATGAVLAVNKFASSLEGIYFASKQTGASAKNIKALGYAAEQLGGSAQGSLNSLRALAAFMRNNPGGENWIANQLGVSTRDEKGNLRDTADILNDVAAALAKMPAPDAKARADFLGIDEDTLLVMRQYVDFIKYQREALEAMKAAGADTDKAAKAAHDYEEGLRRVNFRLEQIGTTLQQKALPYFIKLTDQLGELLKYADQVEKAFLGIQNLWDKFPGEIKKTPPGKGSTGNQAVDDWIRGTWLEYLLHGSISKPTGHSVSGKVTNETVASSASASSLQPRGIRNNNPGNIEYGDFAKRMGATGSDGRFAIFPTAQAGLSAMSALLQSYANRGIDTAKSIVSRWAPKGENDVGAYSRAVANALGVSPDASLNLKDPTVRANLMSAISAHENGRDFYARDAYRYAAGAPVGSGSASTYQQTNQTTIQVVGSGDPVATANAVASAQVQVSASQTRNMKAKIQ